MISRATIFWLIALAGMVLVTVTVSLKVNRVTKAIEATANDARMIQQRIALLDASYQLLVSPEYLAPVAARHLPLVEIRGDQLLPLNQLPDRIPLPTARAPEPTPGQSNQPSAERQHNQRSAEAPLAAPPENPPPAGMPPWLQAQGRNALQPVSLRTLQGRSQ